MVLHRLGHPSDNKGFPFGAKSRGSGGKIEGKAEACRATPLRRVQAQPTQKVSVGPAQGRREAGNVIGQKTCISSRFYNGIASMII